MSEQSVLDDSLCLFSAEGERNMENNRLSPRKGLPPPSLGGGRSGRCLRGGGPGGRDHKLGWIGGCVVGIDGEGVRSEGRGGRKG